MSGILTGLCTLSPRYRLIDGVRVVCLVGTYRCHGFAIHTMISTAMRRVECQDTTFDDNEEVMKS
jgi:hypothetical protein